MYDITLSRPWNRGHESDMNEILSQRKSQRDKDRPPTEAGSCMKSRFPVLEIKVLNPI